MFIHTSVILESEMQEMQKQFHFAKTILTQRCPTQIALRAAVILFLTRAHPATKWLPEDGANYKSTNSVL